MKTVKGSIALKLLTGVVTTAITATGIAVPMMVGSEQNKDDISVIADEDIYVAETVVDTEIIGDAINIVEGETIVEDNIEPKGDVDVEAEAEVETNTGIKDDTDVEGDKSTDTKSAKTESVKTESAKTESAKTGSPKIESEQPASEPDRNIGSKTQPNAQPEQPSEQPHEHNWIAHTNQHWVSQIVTVIDEPERYEEYTVFKIYWYNTGTWEETRDPDRFREWSYSEYGSLYPFYHIEKNEDNPLFLGYNDLGQPSFTSDHALWSGYDFIPAVTHEEDQGHYETYVDYYYCDCGATK